MKMNHLLKAFDARSRSVREVLRQVQAERFMKANPALKINLDVHNRAAEPFAHVFYIDDSDVSFSYLFLLSIHFLRHS